MSDVNVLLFGKVREIVGSGELRLPVGRGETASTLLDTIVARHPKLAEWRPYLRVAVNREYAAWDLGVSPGDEVAVIPPVSGG